MRLDMNGTYYGESRYTQVIIEISIPLWYMINSRVQWFQTSLKVAGIGSGVCETDFK